MSTFGFIAGVASLAGLLFSALAFVQAKSASEAAKAAREAILVRDLSEELRTACEKIDALLDLIQYDRLDESRRVARELASALSEIPQRRSSYLPAEDKNLLVSQAEQVRIIERVIAPRRQSLVPTRKKAQLVGACQNISDKLRQLLGRIRGEMERVGEL